MLGRPLTDEPVFMNVCAGSWLMASVLHDRTMHRSSATSGRWVNSSFISCPLLPCFLKPHCGPKQVSFAPWSCAIGWPLVMLSGIGCPCRFASSGLWSNSSRWLAPPAITMKMTRFAFGGTCGFVTTPFHFSTFAAAEARGPRSDASASAPTPRQEWVRKVRRWCKRTAERFIECSKRAAR